MSAFESVRAGTERVLSCLPIPWLRHWSGQSIAAPFYHAVSTDEVPAHYRYLFRVPDLRKFEADLHLLVRRFDPVSLDDVIEAAHGGAPLPRRAMFLSFDDGLRECTDVIAPRCARLGIPATFFVNSATLDNATLAWRNKASLLVSALSRATSAQLKEAGAALDLAREPTRDVLARAILSIVYTDRARLDRLADLLDIDFTEYLRRNRPYVDSAGLTMLLDQGFAVAAHSVSHPHYGDLALDEQLRETRQCLSELQQRLGPRVRPAFAFPFTSDGVADAFYYATLDAGDLRAIFCVGRMPLGDARIVQRLWLEADAHLSARSQITRRWANELVARMLSGLRRQREQRLFQGMGQPH